MQVSGTAEKNTDAEEMPQGDLTVRTIAMDTTDGLTRGAQAVDTGSGISVPVGPATLGRILNVIGEPIDERGQAAKERPFGVWL